MSPLWPLSERFPEAALELVRSKLPAPTLGIVRLVSRAARNDFVDGRATRVRRLWEDAPLSALVSAAPRLRSVVALAPRTLDGGKWLSAADCGVLAEALERLPGRGVSLHELRLPFIYLDPPRGAAGADDARSLERLAAAVRRLPGLASLTVSVLGAWHGSAAALFEAATALPALTKLEVDLGTRGASPPPQLRKWRPPPPQALRHLEALALGDGAIALWLPALFGAGTAAALPRLRGLELTAEMGGTADWRKCLPRAPWRAPWLAQLTRLVVAGKNDFLEQIAAALPPRALPAVRALEVRCSEDGATMEGATLRAMLAACDAAALEEVSFDRAAVAAARDLVAGLPALRSLTYHFPEFWSSAGRGGGGDDDDDDDFGGSSDSEGEEQDFDFDAVAANTWRGFFAAQTAPLRRLELDVGGSGEDVNDEFLADPNPSIVPLCAPRCCWRASLRELSLRAMSERGAPGAPGGLAILNALRPLSALTALTKLSVEAHSFEAAAFEQAAARRWCAGWARRLVDFELHTVAWIEARALIALLKLPFGDRLERLVVNAGTGGGGGAVWQEELEEFAFMFAKKLPRLSVFEFSAAASEYEDEE